MIVDRIADKTGKKENIYLATDRITRCVECGMGDVGAGVIAGDGQVVVGIFNLDNAVGVGEKFTGIYSIGDARVVFNFDNVKSIDAVIGWFEHAKKLLIEKQSEQVGE